MPSPRLVIAESRISQTASAMGWMPILLALLVVSGWAFHLPALTSVVPGLVTMKPNTAAAFLLTGVALLRRNRRDLTVYALGVLVSQFGCDLQSLSHSLHSSTLENLGLVAGVRGSARSSRTTGGTGRLCSQECSAGHFGTCRAMEGSSGSF